jgi:myo-inositol-1(or 4)-monophosphatase
MSPSRELDIAIATAREAGALLLECFDQGVACFAKGAHDIVTEADHASEKLILSRLRAAFPAHGFVCEESGATGLDCPSRWYVDPLDGTKNFARRHPGFCVTLAYEHAGVLQAAVTYDPTRGELFSAARGQGAYLNGNPVRVSETSDLEQALVVSGFPSGRRHRHLGIAAFEGILHSCQSLRRSGCTGLDLAYTACGRYDLMFDWELPPWDIAAGLLLVSEAGGSIRDWTGSPHLMASSGVIAANAALAAQAAALLTAHAAGPDSPPSSPPSRETPRA